MPGASLQWRRARAEDGFFAAAKPRRHYRRRRRQRSPQRMQSSASAAAGDPPAPPPVSEDGTMASALESREPEDGAGQEEPPPKPVAAEVAGPCNLDRFLESTTPSVRAQYPSKTTMRGWKTCDVELRPFFALSDLWESFNEWSAYGIGVPLLLDGCNSVIQYYVPLLSGIQLYGQSSRLSANSRQLSEANDGDCRYSNSDGSIDYENEKGLEHSSSFIPNHVTSSSNLRINRLNVSQKQVDQQEGSSSDDVDFGNSQGLLLFEFLEQDPPFVREPLADKISDLARHFPALKTLRSCDLLPSSWFSVAWYPIYRIPTGPTLKDLDACFLTFHSLSTPAKDADGVCPIITHPQRADGVPMVSLPIFGLASYKLERTTWTPDGGPELPLANLLLQAADNWLRLHNIDHPDYHFFASHGAYRR